MKKMTYILIGFVGIVLLFAVFMSFRYSNIEMPKYTVIKSYERNIELRQYPNMVVAKTSLKDNSFDQSGSDGFRSIAGYIFGGNDKKEKISMTSPVTVSLEDTMTMMFLVPKKFNKESLPKPNQSKVEFREEPKKTVAAITFGGWADDENIEIYKNQLISLLKKEGIKHTNKFSFLGYNPPFEVFNRKNEVIVEL